MKTVGIITFHASHNYGSMLQAYALQQTVISMGYKCEIINLRPVSQRMMYRPFYQQKGWIKKAKAILFPVLAFNDWRKHRLFERFMKEHYSLSKKEYGSSAELMVDPPAYDIYISGSDQIWNPECADFEKAYYLNFVKDGKRVAYAPSMGPVAGKYAISNFSEFIKKCVSRYDFLSVRETGTASCLKKISGIDAPVALDPTFLPDRSVWYEMAGTMPIVKGNYIFLYTPFYNQATYEEANRLSEIMDMKVIVSMHYGMYTWNKTGNFKAMINIGPTEFLNLVKNARMIIADSFHAVVYSIIFGKPIYAVNGMNDNRISHILKIVGLECLAKSPNAQVPEYDAEVAWSALAPLREKSLSFLKNALS